MPKKALFFLGEFVKIASVLGALPPDPFDFRRLGICSRSTRVCYFFILLQLRPQF